MLDSIAGQFLVPGTFIGAERFGSGLINETWRCRYFAPDGNRAYLLQRINSSVFPRPDLVMENVETVTVHILGRLRGEGVADPERVTTVIVRARDGRSFHVDGKGDVWRMFPFIEDGTVFDTVQSPEHAFEVGRALGRFQSLLSDLAPDRLYDTLPGFHHTPRYLRELEEATGRDGSRRRAGAAAELDFVDQRRHLAPLLVASLGSGRIPSRVVHNDPKVNNVLIHRGTGKAICMIDLDTVKPGIVHFDFGDCVRSAANPAGEDAPELDRVSFDGTCYRSVREGYLSEASPFLAKEEIELLPVSVKVITFELGVRFLADHLRGDTYFRTRHPGHNLHRARVQFRLLESMEKAGM
jgi:Ser/Thr protein kinase RdoA (MazF antagonist)